MFNTRTLGPIRDFFPVILAGLLLFAPCIAFLSYVEPSRISLLCETSLMCASMTTPWGALTSISLFDGTQNLVTFIVCATMFVRLNLDVSRQERAKRSMFFLVSGFGIAIAANVVWMLANPTGFSYGQSGVVYSLMGTIAALACNMGLPKNHFDKSSPKSILQLATSVAVMIFVVLLMLTPLRQLMFTGPGLNAFVHEFTFLASFALTVPFYYLGGRVRLHNAKELAVLLNGSPLLPDRRH
jgi:hypothetical protein